MFKILANINNIYIVYYDTVQYLIFFNEAQRLQKIGTDNLNNLSPQWIEPTSNTAG